MMQKYIFLSYKKTCFKKNHYVCKYYSGYFKVTL